MTQTHFPYLARFSVGGFTPGTQLRLVVVDRTAKVGAKRDAFTVE